MKKFIAIVVVLLLVGGFSAAWEFIQAFAYGFLKIFVAILPFLDLEQVLLCKVVTILMVQILCGLGFYVSHKAKLRIGKIVSGIADAIATILLLVA